MNDERQARIESLLREMFAASASYGCGFYGTEPWVAAYEALAKEMGVDPWREAGALL